MQNKKSEWLKGLLVAEQMGYENAIIAWNRNEFYEHSVTFQNGILDYLAYHKEVLKNVRT